MTVTYRSFRQSDIPALVEIINLVRQQAGGGDASAERLQHMAAAPHLRAEENFFVAVNADDSVVGVSMLMMRPDSGMSFGDVMVHPDYRDAAIMAELLHRAENRIVERAASEVPEGAAVSFLIGVPDNKPYLLPVLESADYHEAMRQYVMKIRLDTPVNKPDFPSELAFRPFDKTRDGRAVHAVFQECFAEHAGDVAKIPYDQWAHQFDAPDFDPTLWYVLYQGDTIAAICLCELKDDDTKTGLVEVLGVRPAFRKRGLGGLLLRHAFYEFQQHGFQYVALDVDTDNSTNAVALYENAGMQVENRVRHFAKVLKR